jgi:hypothetical protein
LFQTEILKEIERIVNNENLKLEEQDAENISIFKKGFSKVLNDTLKIWNP